MDVTAAVVHYPEGAGHATLMLAVARELEARGATVELADGGPGWRFVERGGEPGFAVVESPVATVSAVENQPAAPEFENGAPGVAERVLGDLG